MARRARTRGGARGERRLFRDREASRQAPPQGRAHEHGGSRPPGTAEKILTGGDGIFPYWFARSAAPRIHVRKHGGHFVRAEAQIGHASVLVFLEEGERDRIAIGEHPVRSRDVTGEPSAIPACGHAQEVGSHLVALPDGVADAALALKEVLSLVEHERTRLRIALPRRRILPTQKIRYRRGEELRVVHGGVSHPQSRWFIADHKAGRVAVFAGRVIPSG